MNHNNKGTSCIRRGAASLVILGAVLFLALPAAAAGYVQTNLVSDLPGIAAVTDLDLVNPWGIASSATSPFWVSDNGKGLATLYNGAGVKQGLVVTVPPKAGGTPPGAPTGVVFNPNTTDFLINGNHAIFIFATEDGTISGWNAGTTAILKVDNSPTAVYKGLAMGNNGSGNFLYAANFNAGTIDVFDSTFAPATLAGSFTDPNLPAGYAPFNIRDLGGSLYVTYALANGNHGPGLGIVDVFDFNGNLVRRLTSGGGLDSPWGLALAPGNFGEFSNDLLVGNFGDGTINAFDPTSGNFLGKLTDKMGNPIAIDGLWGLIFGNGANGGDLDTLYFTAGIDGETHGLFGSLAVPVPSAFILLGSGLAGLLTFSRVRKRRA
jgi:uncharacterized protein (TIGR03118 family)